MSKQRSHTPDPEIGDPLDHWLKQAYALAGRLNLPVDFVSESQAIVKGAFESLRGGAIARAQRVGLNAAAPGPAFTSLDPLLPLLKVLELTLLGEVGFADPNGRVLVILSLPQERQMEQATAARAVVRDRLAVVAARLAVGMEDDLLVVGRMPVLNDLEDRLAFGERLLTQLADVALRILSVSVDHLHTLLRSRKTAALG